MADSIAVEVGSEKASTLDHLQQLCAEQRIKLTRFKADMRFFSDSTSSMRKSLVSGVLHCELATRRRWNQELQLLMEDYKRWKQCTDPIQARFNAVNHLYREFADEAARLSVKLLTRQLLETENDNDAEPLSAGVSFEIDNSEYSGDPLETSDPGDLPKPPKSGTGQRRSPMGLFANPQGHEKAESDPSDATCTPPIRDIIALLPNQPLYATGAHVRTGLSLRVSLLDDPVVIRRAEKEAELHRFFLGQFLALFPPGLSFPVTIFPWVVVHYAGHTISVRADPGRRPVALPGGTMSQTALHLQPAGTCLSSPEFRLALANVAESCNLATPYACINDAGEIELQIGGPGASCFVALDGRTYVETLLGFFPHFPPAQGCPITPEATLFLKPNATLTSPLPVTPSAYVTYSSIVGAPSPTAALRLKTQADKDQLQIRIATRDAAKEMCQAQVPQFANQLVLNPPGGAHLFSGYDVSVDDSHSKPAVVLTSSLYYQRQREILDPFLQLEQRMRADGINNSLLGLVMANLHPKAPKALRILLFTEMVARTGAVLLQSKVASSLMLEETTTTVKEIAVNVCSLALAVQNFSPNRSTEKSSPVTFLDQGDGNSFQPPNRPTSATEPPSCDYKKFWSEQMLPLFKLKFPGAPTLLRQYLIQPSQILDGPGFLARFANLVGVTFSRGVQATGTTPSHFPVESFHPVLRSVQIPSGVLSTAPSSLQRSFAVSPAAKPLPHSQDLEEHVGPSTLKLPVNAIDEGRDGPSPTFTEFGTPVALRAKFALTPLHGSQVSSKGEALFSDCHPNAEDAEAYSSPGVITVDGKPSGVVLQQTKQKIFAVARALEHSILYGPINIPTHPRFGHITVAELSSPKTPGSQAPPVMEEDHFSPVHRTTTIPPAALEILRAEPLPIAVSAATLSTEEFTPLLPPLDTMAEDTTLTIHQLRQGLVAENLVNVGCPALIQENIAGLKTRLLLLIDQALELRQKQSAAALEMLGPKQRTPAGKPGHGLSPIRRDGDNTPKAGLSSPPLGTKTMEYALELVTFAEILFEKGKGLCDVEAAQMLNSAIGTLQGRAIRGPLTSRADRSNEGLRRTSSSNLLTSTSYQNFRAQITTIFGHGTAQVLSLPPPPPPPTTLLAHALVVRAMNALKAGDYDDAAADFNAATVALGAATAGSMLPSIVTSAHNLQVLTGQAGTNIRRGTSILFALSMRSHNSERSVAGPSRLHMGGPRSGVPVSAKAIEIFNGQAKLCEKVGAFEEAEIHLKSILTIQRTLHGPCHLAVAAALNSIGYNLQLQGKYEEAIQTYFEDVGVICGYYRSVLIRLGESFNISQAVLGPIVEDSPRVGSFLQQQSSPDTNPPEKEEKDWAPPVQPAKESSYLIPTPEIVESWCSVGTVFEQMGKPNEAIRAYRKGVQVAMDGVALIERFVHAAKPTSNLIKKESPEDQISRLRIVSLIESDLLTTQFDYDGKGGSWAATPVGSVSNDHMVEFLQREKIWGRATAPNSAFAPFDPSAVYLALASNTCNNSVLMLLEHKLECFNDALASIQNCLGLALSSVSKFAEAERVLLEGLTLRRALCGIPGDSAMKPESALQFLSTDQETRKLMSSQDTPASDHSSPTAFSSASSVVLEDDSWLKLAEILSNLTLLHIRKHIQQVKDMNQREQQQPIDNLDLLHAESTGTEALQLAAIYYAKRDLLTTEIKTKKPANSSPMPVFDIATPLLDDNKPFFEPKSPSSPNDQSRGSVQAPSSVVLGLSGTRRRRPELVGYLERLKQVYQLLGKEHLASELTADMEAVGHREKNY